MTRSLLRSEPDCSSSLDPFLLRLSQTVAWSIHRADPANPRESLRNPHHCPRTLAPDYFAAVREVTGGPWRDGPRRARGLAGGRLLVYFPDADLTDGAAALESGRFFDVFNTPPWNTWVAFATDHAAPHDWNANYLITYVPPVFLKACSAGIAANPEECIVWLEDADVAFREILRLRAPELLWSIQE